MTISGLLVSAIKGIPLAGTLIGKLFPKKTVTATVGNEIKEVILPEDEKILVWSVRLLVEAIVVFGFVVAMKKFGVTYEEISTLFGLIK